VSVHRRRSRELCRVMRQPRSLTTPFVSSFSRWPPRTIPARGVTRSVFAMSMAGSSSTTPRLVAPRYKRSSGSMVSSTRCSILDHYARTRGRRQSGRCAIRMILTPSHARRRSLIACLESSRSITSERTRAMTRQRRGAGPSPTTAIDPRPITVPVLSLRAAPVPANRFVPLVPFRALLRVTCCRAGLRTNKLRSTTAGGGETK
jgi:hypothetical protein